MAQIRSGTLAERYQDGVRLRRKTSREKHTDLRGATDRDAVAILKSDGSYSTAGVGTGSLC